MKKIKKYPLLSDAFNNEDINKAIKILKSKKITMSKETVNFEKYFSKKIGSKYALMTNSGSSSNLLAISALTNPLNDKDLAEFKELQKTQADTEKSWIINASDIDSDTYDLSVKNPNTPEEAPLRSPSEILAEMEELDSENKQILGDIKDLI